MKNGLNLSDLGERKIIKQILPKYTSGIGDDCAIIESNFQNLILTTDPVPEPASKILGNDPDPYWMGWLLVTINASDLAAAGAHPLAFLAAIEAPPVTLVDDFERFLTGIKDSCSKAGLKYIGGNLREGSKLSAVGTAIGFTNSSSGLSRTGASHFGKSIDSRGVKSATEVVAPECKHRIDILWIPLSACQLKPLINLLNR